MDTFTTRVFVINTVQGFRVLSANFLSENGFKLEFFIIIIIIVVVVLLDRHLHSLHFTLLTINTDAHLRD